MENRYPFPFDWEPVPRWRWFRYYVLKQRWYRGDELYNPLEYQTDLERAHDALKEACRG